MKIYRSHLSSTVAAAFLAGFTALLASSTSSAQTVSPSAGVYFGAFQHGQETDSLPDLDSTLGVFESEVGKAVSFAHYFNSWSNGSGGTNGFPTNDATVIRTHHSIPLITWQPEATGGAGIPFADIITNHKWDTYIDGWAQDAKSYGYPVFVRFAHEMNGTWYPWSPGQVPGPGQPAYTPTDYVNLWHYVHDRVNAIASNVTWVWCVDAWTAVDPGPVDIAQVYPGDNYVDWLSMDVYNRGGSKSHSFFQGTQYTYDYMITNTDAIAPGKPIMIAENGTVVDSTHPRPQYFTDALTTDLPTNFPMIRAFGYFNHDTGGTPDYDNTIDGNPPDTAAINAFKTGIGSIYYAENDFGASYFQPHQATTIIQPLLGDATTKDTLAPFVSIVTPSSVNLTAGNTYTFHASASDKSGITRVRFYANGAYLATVTTPGTDTTYSTSWKVPSGVGIDYYITVKAYDAASPSNEMCSQVKYTSN